MVFNLLMLSVRLCFWRLLFFFGILGLVGCLFVVGIVGVFWLDGVLDFVFLDDDDVSVKVMVDIFIGICVVVRLKESVLCLFGWRSNVLLLLMMMLLVFSVLYEFLFSVSGRFFLSVLLLFFYGLMCLEVVNDIVVWFILIVLLFLLMKVKVIFWY